MSRTVRVATFNIAHGRGRDRRVDLGRTAAVIEALGADVVLLQEVDRHFGPRSGWRDQLGELADRLGVAGVFGASVRRRAPAADQPVREYGNAVLTRWPVTGTDTVPLPGRAGEEARSLLIAALAIPAAAVTVASVHLQHTSALSRAGQSAAVVASVGGIDPLVLGGDLNATPGSAELRPLLGPLRDVWAGPGPGPTFPARRPRARIDQILVSAGVHPLASWTVPTDASDHLPLVAALRCPDPAASAPT